MLGGICCVCIVLQVSLQQEYFTICQLHDIMPHRSAIPFLQYFSSENRHPSAVDTSISAINPYRYSFFVNSPFLWNNLPASILQITNMSDALFFNYNYFV